MTTTTVATAWAALDTAIRQRRPVQLTYHGKVRLVSPHALGFKNGRPMLLAYQAADHSTATPPTDPRKQWRNMFTDQIEQIQAADPASRWETADNYNPSYPFNSIDQLHIAIKPGDPRPEC
jgi:predicted DNA-binding transcriptional regulator YafY